VALDQHFLDPPALSQKALLGFHDVLTGFL
jgi:hypothetical protein